jgi:RNA polymerase sigma factor (sigma-70 family)
MTAGRLDEVMRHIRRLAGPSPDSDGTDAQLLARYAGGRDEEAFRALVQRHGPMVLGVCRRLLRESHLAEDAFQATFLVLVRRAASIARPELLGNWLYGVAYRVATRARSQTVRRRLHEGPLEETVPALAEDDSTARELRPLLDAEIARLQERYRRPVVLCYLEGRTCEEAGQLLGCPAGTVKSRLSRARDLLQRRLLRQGVVPAVLVALTPDGLLAAVPPELGERAACAALRVAAGERLTECGCSAGASALAEGALHTMTTTRIKLAAVVALLLGMLGAGIGFALHRASAQAQDNPPAAAPAQPPPPPDPVPGDVGKRHGDPLPPGAIARLGGVRLKHDAEVRAVAFAPDGTRLASASADGTLRVWDATTGKELQRFAEHMGPVLCAAYSKDGLLLASGGDDCTARVRDARTGKQRLAIDAHPAPVRRVAFSPDGRVLATYSGGTVRLWTAAAGKLLHTLRTGEAQPPPQLAGLAGVFLAFSGNGRTVMASGPGQVIYLWDATSGEEKAKLDAGGALRAAAFLRDGGKVAVVLRGAGPGRDLVRLWGKAGEKTGYFDVKDSVLALAFSPDGKYLAGTGGKAPLYLWDVVSGKQVRAFRGASRPASAVAFAPDGKTIATADGQRVRLWEVASGTERVAAGGWPGVVSVALSADGKLAALGCRDQSIRIVDRHSGVELRRCTAEFSGEPAALAFLPDGKTVVSVSEASWALRFWDATTGKEVRVEGGERAGFTGNPPLVASPDGRFLAFRSQSTALFLYDVAARKARRLTDHGVGRWPVAFSPDSKRLASAERGTEICLWDTATGKPGKSFRGSGLWPFALAFSPDGTRLASGSYWVVGGSLHVWDVNTGKLLRQIGKGDLQMPRPDETGLKGWHGVALVDGGKRLLAANEKAVHVWDVDTGAEVSVFRGHTGRVNCLACSPDGKVIATASDDQTVLFWDPQARVGLEVAKVQTPEKGAKSPLEAQLVTKKATFAAAPKGLIAKDMGEPLRFHAVDLVLELRNTSKREVKLRLFPRPPANDLEEQAGASPGWLGLRLELKGPIAQVGQRGAGALGRIMEKKEVTIPPGQTHSLPIKSLTYPSKDGNVLNYFLCQAGEYTLTVVFDTVLTPAPEGSKNAGLGFGHVTLRSNTIKLKCK